MEQNFLSPFFETALKYPDRIASTDAYGNITYSDLYENALRFFNTVSALEFPNRKAALYFPNGNEALSAIVSTITAGFCFTALDIATPSERNGVIPQAIQMAKAYLM